MGSISESLKTSKPFLPGFPVYLGLGFDRQEGKKSIKRAVLMAKTQPSLCPPDLHCLTHEAVLLLRKLDKDCQQGLAWLLLAQVRAPAARGGV